MEVKVIPQSQLSGDCWLVQFEGLDACVNCQEFMKEECGGGQTLTLKIIHKCNASIWDQTQAYTYWNDGESLDMIDDKSFHDFLKWCKEHRCMEYPIRKYKRTIESKRIAKSNIPPNTQRLDDMHPFEKEYYDKSNKIINESGYHQMHQCSCVKTTRKGSYRDVIVELPNGDRVYYYHQHAIVKRMADSKVIIDSCGYRTMTTLERINRYLHHSRVYQSKWVWYFVEGNKWKDGIKIYDGMTVIDKE